MIVIDLKFRRVTVFGKRIHHGTVCLFLMCVGALGMLHDRKDVRDWLRFR